MKFSDTFVLQRVYFDDPKGKHSGTGYIKSRCGSAKEHNIEVLLESKFTGFYRGYPTCEVRPRSVGAHASRLTHRGRVVSFFDDKGLKPIYSAWPEK